MRRLYLLVLLFSVIAAYARQVSPEEASAVASEFFNSQGVATRSGEAPIRVMAQGDENGSQPYYVFNSTCGDGFVIVSGDDRYSKILGYSDSGSFDFRNMPPQLKSILERFGDMVSKSTDRNGTHSSWTATPSSTRADEGVLLETAKWNQGFPYNEECPVIDGEHAVTGCVATAMAIVMRYHRWPETYDWDSMPLEISRYDQQHYPAIAGLMKDAGEAVYMDYSLDGSGAYSVWVPHRMQQVFKYSPECQYIDSRNLSNERWLELLRENIDNGNPVIYDGSDEERSGAHAFVLDGYNATGYHVNWGWGGGYNGYYALDALTPTTGYDYSFNNGMVINIVPDKSGREYSDCFMDFGDVLPQIPLIMNISVENVVKGEPFSIVNQGRLYFLPEFNGEFGVALVDKDNNVKEVLHSEKLSQSGTFHYKKFDLCYVWSTCFMNLVVKGDIDSTDRIQFVTKRDEESDYRLVLGTMVWPSYTGVVNNKPKFGKLKLTIGEGLEFNYGIEEIKEDGEVKRTTLAAGTHELNVFQGYHLTYDCGFTFYDSGNYGIFSIHGNLPYVDEKCFIDYRHYDRMEILGDYEIHLRVVETQRDETLVLDEAGTLKDKLTPEECETLRKLTVSGKMNAIDFWYLRNNALGLEYLDLTNVTVEAVNAADDRYTDYDRNPENLADRIPEYGLVWLRRIETLLLPESITGLGICSLRGLGIDNITIPKGVSYIGPRTFDDCYRLRAVQLLNPEPVEIQSDVFPSHTPCPEEGMLLVPVGSIDKYRATPVWKDFGTIMEVDRPVKIKFEAEHDGVRYDCYFPKATVIGYEGTGKDLVIPESVTVDGVTVTVTNIGDSAFEGCECLENLVMPNTIVEVGSFAFSNCRNLKSVKLSENLQSIESYAFYLCENLKTCDLGESLEYLGTNSFYSSGIERVTLNERVAPSHDNSSPFGLNKNLKEFVVAEGNKYFEAIDGVLYRKRDSGLVLECVPGQTETLTLPENCMTIMKNAIGNTENLKEVVFNTECQEIPARIFWNNRIEHVTLPSRAIVNPEAFSLCHSLESATFTGNLKTKERMFHTCENLHNLIIDSPEESVALDGIFSSIYAQPSNASVNIFSSSLSKNFTYSDACVVYVPGRASDGYADTRAAEVKEMWRYNINRKEKVLEIVPQVDGVVIDKVTVNGKEVSLVDGVYLFKGAYNIDVKVDYTLLGRQHLTTHYTAEFNEKVPDTEFTGVTEITGDNSTLIDVYGIDGVLYKKGCSDEDVNGLKQGVYILRQGGKSRKVVITK